MLEYGGAEIQILDLPGIIEGAAEGKGRGRQVISAAKTSDLILMILDATKKAEQRALLEAELEAVGIRLNREPPYAFQYFPHSTDFRLTLLKEHLLETKNRWRDEDYFPESSQEHRSENGL